MGVETWGIVHMQFGTDIMPFIAARIDFQIQWDMVNLFNTWCLE